MIVWPPTVEVFGFGSSMGLVDAPRPACFVLFMAGKRTTHRSKTGTKLYAKRDAAGKFKDIQSYKRAHAGLWIASAFCDGARRVTKY